MAKLEVGFLNYKEGEMVDKTNLVNLAKGIDVQGLELEESCKGIEEHVWEAYPGRRVARELKLLEFSQQAALLLIIAGKMDIKELIGTPKQDFEDVMNSTDGGIDLEHIRERRDKLRANFPWNKTEEIVKG